MADYSRQRAEREFNMNPPTNAPGQGGNDDWDALFSGESTSQDASMANNFTGSGADINSILNGTANPTMGNQANMQQGMQQGFGNQIGGAAETAAIAGAKSTWEYLKTMVTSMQKYEASDWNALGTRICKMSVGVFAFSMVFFLLHITVAPRISDGIDTAVGSCFSCAVGLILLGFNKKGPQTIQQPIEASTPVSDFDSSSGFDDFSFDDSEGDYDTDEGEYGMDEEEEGYDVDLFNDSSDDFIPIDDSLFASNENFNPQEAANNIQDIPAGQYTRQYLFDTFSAVLPLIKPSFMDMTNVIDGSDEFMMYEDYLRRSAEQTGIKEEKLDELQLLEVRKNIFIVQLLATRPTGLKEKEIADGVADCYMHDDYGTLIEGREGVFARVNSQVGKLIIDIFLCNSVMVSLGDVFRKKKDFLLDTNNIMPLIWGISEKGTVFCYDGMKDGNGGMIISGEARSGKSWKGQSLIAQMCMFMSPKELNLYFYDVKGEASDYAYLSRVLPHCKGFCGEALKFNDSIGNLLEREAKRRTEILAGKYTNVKDYNKDHPFDKIPTIYIVIDEMATAMSEMKDKDIEIRKRFDSLLIQIATKYPYLEIKLLLFPHRIVNDIINKTVSSMISTRAVLGNVPAEELKSALDVKVFPYSLVKTGDMAIKTKSLNNGNAVYSHSEVLSTNEQTNRKIFDFIGAVWGRLEPDCKGFRQGNMGTVSRASDSDKKLTIEKAPVAPKDTAIFGSDFSVQASRGTGSNTVSESVKEENDVDESFWDDLISGDDSSDDDDGFDWSQLK